MQSTTDDFFPTAEEKHFFYSALTNVPIESQSFPSNTSEGHHSFPSSSLPVDPILNAHYYGFDPGFMPGSHTLDLNPALPWSTTPFSLFNSSIPLSPNPHTSFNHPLPIPPPNAALFNPPIPLSPIPYASFYPPPPPNLSTPFGPPLLPPPDSSAWFNPHLPSSSIPYASFYPPPPPNSSTPFGPPLLPPPNSSAPHLPSSSIPYTSFYPPFPQNSSALFGTPLPLPPSTNPATLSDPSWLNDPTPSLPTFSIKLPISVPHKIPAAVIPTKKSPTRQQSGSATPSTPNQRKKLLKELKRCKALQNDEYVLAFTKTTVTCAGCMKDLKLDSRDGARYYPGFWEKHKRRCQSVKDMIAAKRQEKGEKEGVVDI